MKKAVIIGAGFAGLAAAKALKQADADVVVIDRTNHNGASWLTSSASRLASSVLPDRASERAKTILSFRSNLFLPSDSLLMPRGEECTLAIFVRCQQDVTVL
jgi:cation diffusion facilitator CzcD-associated flavoprotein CzcO